VKQGFSHGSNSLLNGRLSSGAMQCRAQYAEPISRMKVFLHSSMPYSWTCSQTYYSRPWPAYLVLHPLV